MRSIFCSPSKESRCTSIFNFSLNFILLEMIKMSMSPPLFVSSTLEPNKNILARLSKAMIEDLMASISDFFNRINIRWHTCFKITRGTKAQRCKGTKWLLHPSCYFFLLIFHYSFLTLCLCSFASLFLLQKYTLMVITEFFFVKIFT